MFEGTNRSATHVLPQVRVMMCGYSSQCAPNVLAYLFMKEKLGMNVTWYPTSDYDRVWDGEYWQDWVDPFAYPKYYFEWLYNDSMDMNFEIWQVQLIREGFDGRADYILKTADAELYPEIEGKTRIDYGGFAGWYGEISIYIPKYWADENPTHLIPSIYATDMELREALINGSAGRSTDYGTDWIKKYENSTKFDRTTYDKPVVWGSFDHYSMSEYAQDLVNATGMDVRFVTTHNEFNLMQVVKDLYRQRVPFLANIYTVDDNFAIFDEESGELQQFEKLAFDRNPDQTVTDPCYLAKTCQPPIEPLMKAANPRLAAKFPEAHQFFTAFILSARQLNQIIAYYLDLYAEWDPASDKGHTEVWMEAACQWLKSDDPLALEIWNNSEWLIDVVRKDCAETCGLEYVDGEGAAEGETGPFVGGTCNYYTGLCECDREELFENTHCKQSCPGLLGPFLNESATEGVDDPYYFEFCSGHGTCDPTTRQCHCDLMWGPPASGCNIAYSRYKLPVGLEVVIVLLSCILAAVCILCIVWLRMNKQYKTVKALSVDMTTLMTVGLLMIICSNIATTQRMNSAACIAWQWLFGLGGILAILSPLLKAYRVSRVFHGGKMLRAVKITEKMLMAMLLKAACFEVVVCIAYSVLHEIRGGAEVFYNDEALRTEDQCNGDPFTSYVSLGSYAYFLVMLCALTYYSYGTRRALSVFQESTCAYFSSFLSLFCTVIVMVFYAVTSDPTFRALIQSSAIIVVVSAVLCLFYGTRIYSFFAEPHNRDVTDMNQSTSASTTHNSKFSPVKPDSVMKPSNVDSDSGA